MLSKSKIKNGIFNSFFLTSLIVISSLYFVAAVNAGQLHGPYKQGEAQLHIQPIISESNSKEEILKFNFVIPSIDLVGFDGNPEKASQKRKIRNANAIILDEKSIEDKLFTFLPIGSCRLVEFGADADMLFYHSHKDLIPSKKTDAPNAEESEVSEADLNDIHNVGVDGKSDYLLEYVFSCNEVTHVDFGLMDEFPLIKKINVRNLSISGEIKKVLEKDKAALKLVDIF